MTGRSGWTASLGEEGWLFMAWLVAFTLAIHFQSFVVFFVVGYGCTIAWLVYMDQKSGSR